VGFNFFEVATATRTVPSGSGEFASLPRMHLSIALGSLQWTTTTPASSARGPTAYAQSDNTHTVN
jgi:hypothetical protein